MRKKVGEVCPKECGLEGVGGLPSLSAEIGFRRRGSNPAPRSQLEDALEGHVSGALVLFD
jgi:hypothetical protein